MHSPHVAAANDACFVLQHLYLIPSGLYAIRHRLLSASLALLGLFADRTGPLVFASVLMGPNQLFRVHFPSVPPHSLVQTGQSY